MAIYEPDDDETLCPECRGDEDDGCDFCDYTGLVTRLKLEAWRQHHYPEDD